MTNYTLTNIVRGVCLGVVAAIATDSLVAMLIVAFALSAAFVLTDEVRR